MYFVYTCLSYVPIPAYIVHTYRHIYIIGIVGAYKYVSHMFSYVSSTLDGTGIITLVYWAVFNTLCIQGQACSLVMWIQEDPEFHNNLIIITNKHPSFSILSGKLPWNTYIPRLVRSVVTPALYKVFFFFFFNIIFLMCLTNYASSTPPQQVKIWQLVIYFW